MELQLRNHLTKLTDRTIDVQATDKQNLRQSRYV